MLIWDGYSAHIGEEVRDWCWKHYIIPFSTIPYSTHFLQPLDMVCFQSYKHYHRQAINQAFQLGIYDFNQLDFITAFQEMRKKTFK